MKKKLLCTVLMFSLVFCGGCVQQKAYTTGTTDIAESFPIKAEDMMVNPQLAHSVGPQAILHTTAGDITILLYPQQAPKAVENFIALAEEGYYNGASFFYAKKNELAQTGKPKEGEAEKSAFGEPFEDEFSDELHHFPGAVAMAGDGEDNNLSQFYLLVQQEKPEDKRIVPANLYMNELIRENLNELRKCNKEVVMSEEEILAFEETLNKKIQTISSKGVPEAYAVRYEKAAKQYETAGGAWSLDYKHTVFGQIIKGLNVAEAVTQVKVDAVTRKPKKDVVIEFVEILE